VDGKTGRCCKGVDARDSSGELSFESAKSLHPADEERESVGRESKPRARTGRGAASSIASSMAARTL
jgi:hypothetical protein